jgi:hypothetical protein
LRYFRSTEFIDDAARDSQATDAMELAKFGFAFGQIRDMEAWYAELTKEGGPLYGKAFSVTGYSLGAHLASAFNTMHGTELLGGQPRIQQVVTFNGVGIGVVDPGTNLTQLISQFETLSANEDGQAFTFSDAGLSALYQRATFIHVQGRVAEAVIDGVVFEEFPHLAELKAVALLLACLESCQPVWRAAEHLETADRHRLLLALKGRPADGAERQVCGSYLPPTIGGALWHVERPGAFTARAVEAAPVLTFELTARVQRLLSFAAEQWTTVLTTLLPFGCREWPIANGRFQGTADVARQPRDATQA